jgi:DNA-binding transcriptional MerR regulator
LTRHTIRFYEKEGLLDKRHIRRGENKYRSYSDDAVEYLMMLKAGQEAGFRLGELKELIEADEAHELPLQKKIERIRQKMEEIEKKKAELDRIQTYLAQMLASKLTLQEAEANGTACCDSCTISAY